MHSLNVVVDDILKFCLSKNREYNCASKQNRRLFLFFFHFHSKLSRLTTENQWKGTSPREKRHDELPECRHGSETNKRKHICLNYSNSVTEAQVLFVIDSDLWRKQCVTDILKQKFIYVIISTAIESIPCIYNFQAGVIIINNTNHTISSMPI